MGDCVGGPQFTHVAFDDFRVVRDNLNGGSRMTCDRLIPFCMFTDPELARVGLNERAAKARGIAYRLAKMPMAGVQRAVTLGETRGFAKVLVDAESDRILGFAAFGARRPGGRHVGRLRIILQFDERTAIACNRARRVTRFTRLDTLH
jgi:pyruvate/2-oxoglutarate dehydrogenase complex dihydrolipoamide dehydrogenase (E3) component